MSALKWKRRGPHTYYLELDGLQAFIFRSAAPLSLWAWVVYARRYERMDVAYTYAGARRGAAKAIFDITAMQEIARTA